MALTTDARAAFAFKKLLGLANTQNDNPFFSEVVPSQISITTPEVIGETILEDPTAVNADNVQKVECELQEDPGDGYANGRGYNIVFPQGESIDFRNETVTVDDGSSGSDPDNRKVRDFRISSGGRRSTQIIPQKFNRTLSTSSPPGYGYDLFEDSPLNSTNRIPRTSQVEWQVDPFAGALVSQGDLNLNTSNAVIVLYVYTGLTLDETLSTISGGGGGTLSGLQDTQGPGIDVVDENASTGEVRLAAAFDDIVTNSAPGNNDGTGIDFNYSEPGQFTREATFSVNETFLSENYLDRGTPGDPASESTTGTYNFNSGVLRIGSSDLRITNATNLDLDSNGTLTLEGDLDVTNSAGGFGNITCVDLTEISSARYKTDIRSLEGDAREIIAELNARLFKYKDGDEDQLGFIAEEVAEVLPQAVKFEEGRPEALNYGRVVPTVVEALKDVMAENERLRGRVESLENQLR